MKKFNVIIAQRGRDAHLKTCLHYLGIAAKGYDVSVSVVQDDKLDQPFCKSALLNKGLKEMRQDFDFVSIVDLDMVYRPDFFKIINEIDDDTYFAALGYALDRDHSEEMIRRQLSYSTPLSHFVCSGRSQITISKKIYSMFLDILGSEKLYDERFIGWGAEDSALSFLSTTCKRHGLLNKIELPEMWYHMWHEHTDPTTERMYNCMALLRNLDIEYSAKVKDYVSKN